MTWTQFFAMGGFAVYVWSAYGFAALVLTANVLVPVFRRRVIIKKLRRFLQFDARDPS